MKQDSPALNSRIMNKRMPVCSNCENKGKKVHLGDNRWSCPNCGFEIYAYAEVKQPIAPITPIDVNMDPVIYTEGFAAEHIKSFKCSECGGDFYGHDSISGMCDMCSKLLVKLTPKGKVWDPYLGIFKNADEELIQVNVCEKCNSKFLYAPHTIKNLLGRELKVCRHCFQETYDAKRCYKCGEEEVELYTITYKDKAMRLCKPCRNKHEDLWNELLGPPKGYGDDAKKVHKD